jgi:hypothetical protein
MDNNVEWIMQEGKDFWKYRLSNDCSCWSKGSLRLPDSFGTHRSPYGRPARTVSFFMDYPVQLLYVGSRMIKFMRIF